MNIDKIKIVTELLLATIELRECSGEGLITYAEDSESDHQDGQQVGRETAYDEIIKVCVKELQEFL